MTGGRFRTFLDSAFKKVQRKQDDSKKVITFEIETAVGIACHSAIRSVDHLGEIMIQHGEGSTTLVASGCIERNAQKFQWSLL